MFLGALLDLGIPLENLKEAISTLPLKGFMLTVSKEKRSGLTGTKFTVEVDYEVQVHRTLKDIKNIIKAGDLCKEVEEKSISVFESIAVEEGKIHGHSKDEVHFHEIGAVDSIIDIVGTIFCLESLELNSIFSSSLPLGSGFIESRHGRIPIPAPATLALLKGVPVYNSGLKYELVTPTGAALIKQLVNEFEFMPSMTIEKMGYGVGGLDLPDRPNLLRIIIGNENPNKDTDTVVILEANLDDTNPEWSGFLMEELFKAGALDVVYSPIQMKKNRLGIKLSVIGKPYQQDELTNIIFRESSTLGIRLRYSQRRILRRTHVEVESPWGKMRVKKVIQPDGSVYLTPEYEICRGIAEENSIPLKEIYCWVCSLNRP